MCIVTFTTCGYGDLIPQTLIGKFLMAIVAILGQLFILSLPIAIIGTNIQEIFKIDKETERENRKKEKILQKLIRK